MNMTGIQQRVIGMMWLITLVANSSSMVMPSAAQAINAVPVITQVNISFNHACAVGEDGDLWCWGSNSKKEIGRQSDSYRLTPTIVEGVSDIVSVALAESSTCALSSAGRVQCWGNALAGQLGSQWALGDIPTEVTDLNDAVQISAGYQHYCVLRADGTTWCWGQNSSLQVSPSAARGGVPFPIEVTEVPNAIDVAVGGSHSCILTTDGKVWCWGANDQGQLGNGSVSAFVLPAEVPGLANVTEIAAQGYGTCALNTSNEVWCWGYNNEGQLGIGKKSLREASPTRVQGLGLAERIWAGPHNTCAQNSIGKLFCWGYNFSGQLLTGDVSVHLSPMEMAPAANIRSVGIGFGASCVLSQDSSILCWGTNNVGQLGNGRRSDNYQLLPTLTYTPVFDMPNTAQSIQFGAIPNRTTSAPQAFNLTAVSDSGLPVDIRSSDTSVCVADGAQVTLTDLGTCTLTASQQGYGSYLAAVPVVQQFEVSRTMLANKSVQFVDADGAPASGLNVAWASVDGRYSSSKTLVTDASGFIKFPLMPGGRIRFSVSGIVSGWQGSDRAIELVMGSATKVALNVSSASDSFDNLVVRVQLPDGTPVPGAKVIFNASCGRGNWMLLVCNSSRPGVLTDLQGVARLTVPFCYLFLGDCPGAWAVFDDGGVSQRSSVVAFDLTGEALIELEQLPVVDIEAVPASLSYGQATVVTAVARDGEGNPIPGQLLVLSASTSGASASCTGRKTTATTNSAGRATFKVCPVKTATWSVDGRSIVGSAGVRLTVQLTPTAPRTLVATAKTRSVSLAWVVPVKANASAVTDYIVQYRLQGSSTWITFRDGTSTARKATVTGLIKGRVYEFRIAAKNKAGTGTWSVTVLRAAK